MRGILIILYQIRKVWSRGRLSNRRLWKDLCKNKRNDTPHPDRYEVSAPEQSIRHYLTRAQRCSQILLH